MVTIAPASVLGLLVLFIVGTYLTQVILKQVIEIQDRDAERFPYRPPIRLGFLTERRIEPLSYILGGGGAISLATAILAWVPPLWRTPLWRGLIGLGILFGIATFFLSGPSVHRSIPIARRPASQRGRQAHPDGHPAGAASVDRQEQARARARSAQRAKILAMLRQADRAGRNGNGRRSLEARREQNATETLSRALNALFRLEHIPIREQFGPALGPGGARLSQIDAVVEIDWVSCFVEVYQQTEPLDVPQVSAHLVRAYAGGCANALLISTAGFTPSAVAACKDALARKKVVLCELGELVRLLEREGELKDFLLLKIAAAVVDENPLFQPS